MNKIKFIRVLILGLVISLNQILAEDDVQEVVVISSKYPVPLEEVVGSVDSISLEDLETRMVSDLGDMLDKTIGVSVSKRNVSGRAYNDGISIRGLGGKRVNILIDGIRVAEAYTGYGRDVVDVDLLKRVEILKGPSSALYGSDGLAGAVSYITKDPSDLAEFGQNYFSVNTSYDQDNEQTKVGLLAARVGESLESLIQITTRELSQVELHDDATQELDPFDGEQLSILAKFKLSLSDSVGLTLTLDSQEFEGDYIFKSQAGMSYFPDVVSASNVLGVDDGNRDRGTLSLDFSNETSMFDNGSIRFYVQETDQKQITTRSKTYFAAGPPTMVNAYRDYQFNQDIDGFSADFFKSINNNGRLHNIVYGFEIENIEIQRPRIRYETNLMTGAVNTFLGGEYYPNKTIPDTQIERQSFFFNDRLELNEKTTIVFGARYDGYELTPTPDDLFYANAQSTNELYFIDDSEVSMKLGFLRNLSEEVSFYAQYAEGFRAPDFQSANLSFTNLAFRYAVGTSTGLQPEESEGYEFGFKGATDNMSWTLSFYDNDYENFIDTYITGSSPQGITLYEYGNLDEVEIKGVEFEMNADLSDNLQASLGFSVPDGNKNGEQLVSIDSEEAILGLVWNSNSGKLKLSGYANITAGSHDNLPPSCGRSGCNPLLALPGTTTIDVYGSYELTSNLKLRFAIRNLTDESYWNWASVQGKSSTDTNLDIFMEPGRNMSMGLKYDF
jgi:hemoglobin/transferrin/lactoferrin receptor protein